MNKNKLITFILNDISELDMLTKCMESMETIPFAMHDLALQKVRNILSEFEQLSVESKEECRGVKESKVANMSVAQAVEVQEEIQKPEVIQKPEAAVAEKVQIEQKQAEQEQKVNIQEEFVSPKNATIAVETAVVDTVKVVVKEPEPKFIEEMASPAPVAEEKKEVAKVVEQNAPEPVSEPVKEVVKPVTEQPKVPVSNPVITNERFKGGRRLESRFVTDLRKALTLTDRFRYQKELFGGDMALLNKTVDTLNAMSSLQEAETYVAEHFNWNTTEGAAFEFMELLEARFTK